MKSIIVDLDRCNGCFNCQIACKDEHCDNDWRPIAAPQPMTGQFWCKVDQKERGRVPVVSVDYTPTFCGMCDNAECMNAVSDGSVYRREASPPRPFSPRMVKAGSTPPTTKRPTPSPA